MGSTISNVFWDFVEIKIDAIVYEMDKLCENLVQ